MASCYIRGSTRIGNGPNFFFVIFINPVDQLFEHLATILSKFADDTKTGRAVNNDKDHQLLQEALDTLVKWAEDWQMSFNASKCKVIHFGKNNKHYVYTMGGNAPAGTILESTSEEKDIGVIISDSLKPSTVCSSSQKGKPGSGTDVEIIPLQR